MNTVNLVCDFFNSAPLFLPFQHCYIIVFFPCYIPAPTLYSNNYSQNNTLYKQKDTGRRITTTPEKIIMIMNSAILHAIINGKGSFLCKKCCEYLLDKTITNTPSSSPHPLFYPSILPSS